jgi:hypothetical protein
MKKTTKPDPQTLEDIALDPKNARKHTERNLGMIEESIRENGAGRSILVDENNQLIAGEGTVRAARAAGLKVKVVDTDSDTLIAVRRSDLTPEQKTRLALFDNRTAELAEWDSDTLKALAEAGTPMDGIFGQDELDALTTEDEGTAPIGLKVDRPTDVAWILIAVPMTKWPSVQPAVEQLQTAGVFTTTALRPAAPEKKAEKGAGRVK